MANSSSSRGLHACGNSAFAATTAPTAEAAEPPRPEPSGIPLSISSVNPNPRRSASCIASSARSEEHTSELQSQSNLVCRLLLEKKKKMHKTETYDRQK